jgi:hypothetical protein
LGNFVVVIGGQPDSVISKRRFQSLLNAAFTLKGQRPFNTMEAPDTLAATFARENGTVSTIAMDEDSGNWLLSSGTWFHESGLASGDEIGLLREYQRTGVGQLARSMEGFFVITIGDVRRRVTYAITDLVGSCHGFWTQAPEGICLSGSSLLLANPSEYTLDQASCQEFLNLGVIYEDRTLFSSIRKLRPASIYCFTSGRLSSVEQYWCVTSLRLESYNGDTGAEALWEKLRIAASRVAKLFPRTVCDLTGGYDSRAMVSSFLASGLAPHTVVSGAPESGDVQVSTELARSAGLQHRHMAYKANTTVAGLQRALQFTDGEYDVVEYESILGIHSNLSIEFDASCNGSFGEVARGFWWEVLWPHTGKKAPLDAMRVARLRYATGPFRGDLFPLTDHLDIVTHLRDVINRTGGNRTGIPNTSLMDQIYLWMRMQRWQGRIASSTNQIWPCLSPFLFRSVLEVMLETQAKYRRKGLLMRIMLARFLPCWAAIPLEHGYPAVPVNWKNWYRFAPLVSHYGRKIIGRISQRVGVRSSKVVRTTALESPVKQLWCDERTKILLDPEQMRCCAVLDSNAVAAFLEQSRGNGFAYSNQWCRLLTLELALRSLDSSRGAYGM